MGAKWVRLLVLMALVSLAGIGCQPSGNEGNSSELPAESNGAEDGDTEEAENGEAEKLREAAYPYQLLKELAQVYLKHNVVDEALRMYQLAIDVQLQQTNTEDAENWIGFGDALAKAGRQEEAARSYQRALSVYEGLYKERGPDLLEDPILHNQYVGRISQLYGVLGNQEKRREWLAKLRADENNWQQQVELAGINEQLERFERAEECYKRALELTEEGSANRAVAQIRYAAMLNGRERGEEAATLAHDVNRNEAASDDVRRAARRLLFEIYDARGELDKLDFKQGGNED